MPEEKYNKQGLLATYDNYLLEAENQIKGMSNVFYCDEPNQATSFARYDPEGKLAYQNRLWGKFMKAFDYANARPEIIYACTQGIMDANGNLNKNTSIQWDWRWENPEVEGALSSIMEDGDSGFSMAFKLKYLMMLIAAKNHPSIDFASQWWGVNDG